MKSAVHKSSVSLVQFEQLGRFLLKYFGLKEHHLFQAQRKHQSVPCPFTSTAGSTHGYQGGLASLFFDDRI